MYLSSILSPFGQDGHDSNTKCNTRKGEQKNLKRRTAHVWVEHELVGEELNEAGVQQDTGADSVENTVDELLGVGIVGFGTNTGSDTNGGGQGIDASEDEGHPSLVFRPGSNGQTRPQTQALEHLVEHQDDQEDDKVVSGTKGEADEHTVEHDTEFKDEDGEKLATEATGVTLLMLALVGKMGFSAGRITGFARSGLSLHVGVLGKLFAGQSLLRLLGRDEIHGRVQFGVDIAVTVTVAVTVLSGIVHHPAGQHFDKEHDNDGHEGDGLSPVVSAHPIRQTLIGEVLNGGDQQVHERRGNDDAGTDKLADEEGELWDGDLALPGKDDGGNGAEKRRCHDDEDGANSEPSVVESNGIAAAV